MKSSNNSDDFLLMGGVAGVHGIRGALKVVSYAESPEVFMAGNPLRVVDARGTVVSHVIDWVKPHKTGLLMALKGVATREGAEALVRSELYIRKEDLPEREEDAYYWFELIGMSVTDLEEGHLGTLSSVFPTGSNDVLVVTDRARGKGYELLIPALASVIQSVDLSAKAMIVSLPPELKPERPHGFD